jgi:hypothetical protein
MSSELNIPSGESNEGYYELQKMREIHREIVRQRIAFPAISQKRIAEKLGITAQMVGYTLNSPIVKQHLAALRGFADQDALNMQARLRALGPEMVNILADIASNGDNETNRRLAASDLLDRVPETSKTQKHEYKDTSEKVSEEDMKRIRELSQEGVLVSDPEIEDVEVEDIGTESPEGDA